MSIEKEFLSMISNPSVVGETLAASGEQAQQVVCASRDKDVMWVAKTLQEGHTISPEMAEWCAVLCAEAAENFGLDPDEMDQALRMSSELLGYMD
ncbi:MAG TPA: hypothetical protein VHD60_03045 [Candidatus Saccharimonadales bacterium]|nr:hypothetical protein [Candidatus Saccharimonadales bacterium]